MQTVRILHTADWHLGRELAGADRSGDFEIFLSWLLDEVRRRDIDVVLVSGDVFNTSMPSNAAQRLYYEFVRRAAETPLRAVVITAGNHDSAYFLGAARGLLASCRCIVAGDRPEDQAVLIRDAQGRPLLAVAAVPYLREGDVASALSACSDWDDPAYWRAGVRRHYERVSAEIDRILAKEGLSADAVPRVAMGHLFMTGEGTSDGATEQNSHYVGSLRHIGLDALGPGWTYAALGHVHEVQRIRGGFPAWYAGAPLTLRFADRAEKPSVLVVTMGDDGVDVDRVDVPQPRRIQTLSGSEDMLDAAMEVLREESAAALLRPMLEIIYTGAEPPGAALLERLQRRATECGLILGPIRLGGEAQRRASEDEEAEARITLDDITPEEVFRSVLEERNIEQEAQASLLARFAEALAEVERDRPAHHSSPV